eukprot:GEMP01105260.1.p1 GENE.GEMP01105260.1~~GEMP01105260.1.p1  ORF type:complete len:124 (+),score=30.61 GEMP01105260.1:132-503(+)
MSDTARNGAAEDEVSKKPAGFRSFDADREADAAADYLRKHFRQPLRQVFDKLSRERPADASALMKAVLTSNEWAGGATTDSAEIKTMPVRHYLSTFTPTLLPPLVNATLTRPADPLSAVADQL